MPDYWLIGAADTDDHSNVISASLAAIVDRNVGQALREFVKGDGAFLYVEDGKVGFQMHDGDFRSDTRPLSDLVIDWVVSGEIGEDDKLLPGNDDGRAQMMSVKAELEKALKAINEALS